MTLEFDVDFIYPGLTAVSFADAITQMSKKLIDRGYVIPAYPNKVIEREASFPTGIQLESMVVGIPHTDSENVNKTKVSVATLKKPIKINNMINSEETLETKLLFLIAMADPKGQVKILQQLMKLFKQTATLKKAVVADSAKSLFDIFTEATTLV